jgi:hypothetical protein
MADVSYDCPIYTTSGGTREVCNIVNDPNGIGLSIPTKNTAGAPAGSTGTYPGEVVFNTNDLKLYIFTGSAWKSVLLS